MAKVAVETAGATTIVSIDRFAEARNAVDPETAILLREAFLAFDADDRQSVAILTGRGGSFCAGYDLKVAAGREGVAQHDPAGPGPMGPTRHLLSKPVIAAVSGFALGGGCELAMMCDFIIAADNARFGQPEIKLGIIPGAGGTQRLPRAVGKAKAMDMALTGRMMDAAEAERAGLVSRVVALDKLMDEALGAALQICDYSQMATMAAKESVNRAFEGSLSDGVMFERRLFHALFATADQKEGMEAFVAKRKANFRHA